MRLGALVLGNAAALWVLGAIPALVAVHFFQQRARRVALSTRFLIEALAPESQGGRTWESFRFSRVFWLQVMAVLLIGWVLAEPRWPRADSAQTVVIVLDDALAMQAVAAEARVAAGRLMLEAEGRAARTEWIVMGSDPRAPLRYRGVERARAEAALASWQPALGTHDYATALRQGRALVVAGGGGVCWFVTDRQAKVPTDQAAQGVGRALANAGFAGGLVVRATEGADELVWRAVVKNQASEAQRRTWWIESAAGASERRALELSAGGVIELSGVWPRGAERATLRLDGDGFAADDALPLVRPEWKTLSAGVSVDGEAGVFFRKLLKGIEGVKLSAASEGGLRVAWANGAGVDAPGAAVLLAKPDAAGGEAKKFLRAPVVAEKHPLVAGLNWQGLLGPGPASLAMAAGDEALLWQAERPLVWLRAGAEGRRALVLNFEWEEGNAGRLPATVLLLRHYVEQTREAQKGAYAANFDAGARVEIAEADRAAESDAEWSREREGDERQVLAREELAVLRAPAEAGFFMVKHGEQILVRGAAQFADARQGDFRDAEVFRREPSVGEREAAIRRNTQEDPLAALWLALAGAALMASWWPGWRSSQRSGSAEVRV
jgi:Aerotolerance regulator N-terminal